MGAGEVLQLRDGRTGDLRTELPGHSGAVMGIAYAGPQSDMIWTAGRDGTGIAWDRTGQRGILRSAPSEARTWLGDTDDSGTVAVGLSAPSGAFNTVSVLDPRTGSVAHPELQLPADCRWCESTSVAITPDGHTALAGVVRYPEIGGTVDYSAPDQNRGYLQRWDTSTGSILGTTELPWPPAGLAVTADGRGVVVNGNRAAALLDLATGQTRWGPVPHTAMQDRDATRTVSISPDGRRVLVGTGDGAQILDADAGEILAHNTFAEPDAVSATAFSADGTAAILGTYGGYLHVLSATDLQPMAPRRLTTGGWLIDLAVSPDGAYLASLGGDGDVLLWDTAELAATRPTHFGRQRLGIPGIRHGRPHPAGGAPGRHRAHLPGRPERVDPAGLRRRQPRPHPGRIPDHPAGATLAVHLRGVPLIHPPLAPRSSVAHHCC